MMEEQREALFGRAGDLVLKDSGERRSWETGAQRDCSSGKGRFDLLSGYALFRLARVYEAGAQKYDDHNWRKGIPLSKYLDSALRHLAKYLSGWRDEDHLGQAMWNIAGAIETEERIRRGDLPASLNDLVAPVPEWEERPIVTREKPADSVPPSDAAPPWPPSLPGHGRLCSCAGCKALRLSWHAEKTTNESH